MIDPLYNPDELLNRTITLEQVTKVIMASNPRSASGIDNIPYAVLKSPSVIAVLHNLFQLILDSSCIPSIWRKSVIQTQVRINVCH